MERENQRGHGFLAFILGIIMGVVLGYFLCSKGYIQITFPQNESTIDTTMVIDDSSESSVSVVPAEQPAQTSPANRPTPSNRPTANTNAVTMVSYSHDWLSREAQVSVKNNTNRDITSITARMEYYDMKGNMLDYQDFTTPIDIERGMTKRFSLPGYNHEEYYAYYKSEYKSSEPQKKYKVKFIFKSCQYK